MSKNILLGVTGGIAAYKAINIVSLLKKQNYNVKVIMTENAMKIASKIPFEILSENKVTHDMWGESDKLNVEHVELVKWADLFLIAPATYNIIGKVSSGIADDFLSTAITACEKPVYFALAMNNVMYKNPILTKNIEYLKKLNYNFIEAEKGFLACNDNEIGRLMKEEDIVNIINNHFQISNKKLSLQNKKILITAGRTEESLDPIRYMSNKSTGKMGYEIAKECRDLGAEVTLVSGPSSECINGVNLIKVKTAEEMFDECKKHYDNKDVVIGTAAVSDYRAKKIETKKIKKSDGDMVITLVRNKDILFELGKKKKKQYLVGFAAESENIIENAMKKYEKKNLDMIVANDVKYFGDENNSVTIITKDNKKKIEELNKSEISKILVNQIAEELKKKKG